MSSKTLQYFFSFSLLLLLIFSTAITRFPLDSLPFLLCLVLLIVYLARLLNRYDLTLPPGERWEPSIRYVLLGIGCYTVASLLSFFLHGEAIFTFGRVTVWVSAFLIYLSMRGVRRSFLEQCSSLAVFGYLIWMVMVAWNARLGQHHGFLPLGFSNGNVVAFQLVGLSYLGGFRFSSFKKPWIYLIALALFWPSPAIGGLLVLGVIEILFRLPGRWKKGAAIGCLGIALVLFSRYREPRAIVARQEIWSVGWERILEQPFFGSGIGTFIESPYRPNSFVHTHNIVLQVLLETGIVGLLSFLCFVVAMSAFVMKKTVAAQKIWFAFLLWGLFDDPFMWIGPTAILALAVASSDSRKAQQ
ncbi:O-antigen ligase family protein [bacterium]|nr:O-antigen ligase family protein [bacterium]